MCSYRKRTKIQTFNFRNYAKGPKNKSKESRRKVIPDTGAEINKIEKIQYRRSISRIPGEEIQKKKVKRHTKHMTNEDGSVSEPARGQDMQLYQINFKI